MLEYRATAVTEAHRTEGDKPVLSIEGKPVKDCLPPAMFNLT